MQGQSHNGLNDALELKSDNVIAFSRHTRRTKPTESTRGSTHQTATLIQLWEKAGERDGLDGVPPKILETLERLGLEGRPGALCVLRLNEYRLLEETFGRRIGLVLMQRVGDRLRRHLRGDDLLAQIGEDEFVILLNGQQDNTLLSHIAERLLRDCTGTYTLEGLRMHVNGTGHDNHAAQVILLVDICIRCRSIGDAIVADIKIAELSIDAVDWIVDSPGG